MLVNIRGDLYNTAVIAFVRKLKKPTKEHKFPDGSKTDGGKEYVARLRNGYSLDANGKSVSLFLTKEEGEDLIKKVEALQKKELSVNLAHRDD